ncbi:hypothetical protein RHSIM_Rhsim08G0178400 [Rhododendron simsii]|uniref:DUF868 family protein n=1 Tax=Rhododendron simsii TaxID=118357 RepID=A0A834GQ64_RHOSS|nr:hypothetical protein RHSIM_Rhsim08G0178400 [Rhododendron simsii]
MQDPIAIAASFPSGEKPADDTTSVTKSGQSVYISVYKTKIADQSRSITITWCKNLLLHGLSVSLQGPNGEPHYNTCKIELKPWCFWRKQGSKRFTVDGKQVEVFWDLKSAKFNGETEPCSEYYVAVVCDEEVVLLIGDLKKDAYRKTGCRPALIDPIMVSRREHVFGKRKFSTRIRFRDKGRFYGISIECKNVGGLSTDDHGGDPEMDIKIDGGVVIQVKHLQWKFRGNEYVYVNKVRVEVYWDVHDWLFSPGLRHALFIFKPNLLSNCSPSSSTISSLASTPLSSQTGSSGSVGDGFNGSGSSSSSESSEFCLFLYAWKVE